MKVATAFDRITRYSEQDCDFDRLLNNIRLSLSMCDLSIQEIVHGSMLKKLEFAARNSSSDAFSLFANGFVKMLTIITTNSSVTCSEVRSVVFTSYAVAFTFTRS